MGLGACLRAFACLAGLAFAGTAALAADFYQGKTINLLVNFTAGLLRHGHSESTVKKVLGENFLRVVTAVWK